MCVYKCKYLGVNLDHSLDYRAYLEKIFLKLHTRNNIIAKLADTEWGANAKVTLRTAAFTLVYFTVEFCSPVWLNSCRVTKIDV